MDYQDESEYPGNCPFQGCRRVPWYCKYIKPFFSFVVSVLLALSMSHICEKLSSNNSFQMIKSDLSTVRNNINILSNEVRELTESRDELKMKLKEIACVIPKLSDAILYLRNEVAEGIDVQTRKLLEAVSPDSLKKILESELRTYDADKIAKPDLALESAGGTILSIRDTETYEQGAPVIKLFGLPVCPQAKTPRAIIQAGVLPGECWAFKGSEGKVVIRLVGNVVISGFSLEHISPMVSPTGEISSAPKDFSIYGLDDVDDRDGVLLGSYTYSNAGPPIQYFENKLNSPFEIIELKIHSNHGNKNYTCVYRIRVHGILVTTNELRS